MFERTSEEVIHCGPSALAPSPGFGQPCRTAGTHREPGLFSELKLAAMVQRHMLQRNTRQLRTLRYAAAYLAAGDIGGDYFDFLDLGPASLGIVLGDVAGNGPAAALMMSSLHGWIRCECARGIDDLAPVLYRVNAHLLESTLPEHYATLFFGKYDDNARCLTYINCGQQPAIILRADGTIEPIETTALPVGLLTNWIGENRSVTFQQGDSLWLASDGVIEAGIDNGFEFSRQGLVAALAANSDQDNIQAAVSRIAHLAHTCATGERADDMTVVGARIL